MTQSTTVVPSAKHSTGQLARMQQVITMAAILLAMGWLVGLWPYSPIGAVAGALFWLFGFILLLAAELVLMLWVNRRDPVPRPSGLELFSAWAHECVIALQVFAWRQPFRPQAVPDQLQGAELHGQRGVVFLHGLVCNRGFWTPWLARLYGRHHAFQAVSLEPVFGSISAYGPLINAAVKAVTQASGLPPVLVCHSMGGVAARAWLASYVRAGEPLPVHRIITIGSPHRGTWLARWGRGTNTAEMREGSRWLAQLNTDPALHPPSLFVCWYSNCDHIVFPASTSTLPGADNRLVRGAAHMQLAFVPQVIDETLALLKPAAAKRPG